MVTGNDIKKELKANGINTKNISVKRRGGSFNVNLKTLDYTIEEVTAVVEKFEKYHVDNYTGEILSGGNTFVFVSYDSTFRNALEQEYMDASKELITALTANEGRYVNRFGVDFCIPSNQSYPVMIFNNKNDNRSRLECPHTLAFTLAKFNHTTKED